LASFGAGQSWHILAGAFKQYANKRLIEKESEIAWEKAMKGKHDLP